MNKPEFLSNLDWELLIKNSNNLEEDLLKLKKGYPLQYIINSTEFYGYDFYVNEDVLIPRFETETLIEKTIKYIKKNNLENSKCIDIGTGSGAISITLKKELPTLEITGIDISEKALEVAKQNSKRLNTIITFYNKDIFKDNIINKYDIIISNPPYIEIDSNYNKNIMYEPEIALFVPNEDPLVYYNQVLKVSKSILNEKHLIAFEIDENHGIDCLKLSKEYYPNDQVFLEQDLCGKNRYIFIISE